LIELFQQTVWPTGLEQLSATKDEYTTERKRPQPRLLSPLLNLFIPELLTRFSAISSSFNHGGNLIM